MEALGRVVVVPVLRWMGAKYAQPAAVAMLLAIANVESACRHRRQIRGPARGLWQFERGGGVAGVRKVVPDVWAMALAWGLPDEDPLAHEALAYADVPACILARGLLWSLPDPLPVFDAGEGEAAYAQYREAWRPGRPCSLWTFDAGWRDAVRIAERIA